MASKRLANNDGAQDATLNSVKSASSKVVLNGLSEKEKPLVEAIMNSIFNLKTTHDKYVINVASTSINAILGRIASLLDEVKDDFTSKELADVKTAIISSVNNILQDLPKNNDTIDIEQITSKIIDKIQTLQDSFTLEIKSQLETFITENTKSKNEEKTSESADFIVDQIINKVNSDKEDTEKPVEKNDDFTKNINELVQLVAKCYTTIDNKLINIENIIRTVSLEVSQINQKIDIVLDKINSLLPTSKDKKDKKNEKNATNAINKVIMQMSETIEKINQFFNNFIDYLANNFQTLLNKVYGVFVKFWIKLMIGVVVPTLTIIGAFLYLLAEPLMKILQPILDFVDNLIGKILDFLAPIRDFVLDILKRIFDAIEPALVAFFKGLASVAEKVAIGLGLFVTSVLNVLKLLMDGIATGAFALGQALVTFATSVINVLVLFMKGLSTQAEAIGKGLGKFVTVCLDVLTALMEGFGTYAKKIGEAIGKVVLAVVEVVALLVQFLKECVGILVAIVGTIRDFFEGIRSKAKAIGEMIGTIIYNFFKGFNTKAEMIGEAVADFVLETAKLMTKIVRSINNISRIIDLYVVAPITALKIKFRSGLAKLADYDGWGSSVTSALANAFGWGSLSKEEQQEARDAQNKSVGDLIAEQMQKTKEKFAAEDKAEELAKINAKLQQQKIQQMLDSIHVIDDIFTLVKELHTHFLGEEKTTAALSIQAIQPNLEQLENIQTQDQQAKDSLQQNLEQEKQQVSKPKKQDNFKDVLMTYLDEKFGNIMKKLDQPQVLPIPLQSGLNNNIAGLEDM